MKITGVSSRGVEMDQPVHHGGVVYTHLVTPGTGTSYQSGYPALSQSFQENPCMSMKLGNRRQRRYSEFSK